MKSKLVSLFVGLLMAAAAVLGTALAPACGPGGKCQAPDLRLRGLPREQPLLDHLASGPSPVRAVLGDAARNRSQDGRSHPGAGDEVGASAPTSRSGPSTCARASSSTTATASSRPRTSCTPTRCSMRKDSTATLRPFWAHGRGSEARRQAHGGVPLQGAGDALDQWLCVLALRRPAHDEQGAVGQGGRRRPRQAARRDRPLQVRRAADGPQHRLQAQRQALVRQQGGLRGARVPHRPRGSHASRAAALRRRPHRRPAARAAQGRARQGVEALPVLAAGGLGLDVHGRAVLPHGRQGFQEGSPVRPTRRCARP